MTVLPVTASSIRLAAALIRQGRVVAFPTETSYGLAADPRAAAAIRRLCAIKGRGRKPVALIACDLRQAKRIGAFSPMEEALARRFWPGPLTLVVRKRVKLPGLLTAGRPRIGIRVSENRTARALARACGFPITATSANRSGTAETYSIATLRRAFQSARKKPDLVLDGGTLRQRPPSTVVEIRHGRLLVHRSGPMTPSIPSQHV